MTDSQDSDYVAEAVEQLFPTRYRKAPVLSDAFSEFKSFTEAKTAKPAYFRIHHTPLDYRYSLDSHNRIVSALGNHILSVEVERFDQTFQRASYLLKSNANYVNLKQLILIKKTLPQQPDIKFIMLVLSFFQSLLPILVQERIELDLKPKTICFWEDRIRLCDYDIFFLPKNRRSDRPGLSAYYIAQIGTIVYSLLTYKLLDNQFVDQVSAGLLLEELQNSQSLKEYKEGFIGIVRNLLLQKVLSGAQITKLTTQMVYDSGSSMTDSHISIKQTFYEDLSGLSKKASISETGLPEKPKVVQHKVQAHRTLILGIVVVILALCMIGLVLYFVLQTQTCKPNEYQQNHRCYPCFDGCKTCFGRSSNMCAKCWGTLWLVKGNNNDTYGSCQSSCVGQQLQGRQCIIGPSNPQEQ